MILTRYGSIPDIGTFGVLQIGVRKFYTVERPWNNNIPFTSCVPSGAYSLVEFDSPKYGLTYAMVGDTVSKYQSDLARYACLLHAANWPHQVEGCIGIGEKLMYISGKLGVTNSKNSMKTLLKLMKEADDYTLTIQYATH